MEFTLNTKFKATAKEVYDAWLDSKSHSEMTGTDSKMSKKVGGKFIAGDGYIEGKNLILDPYRRIVQSWRTTEFEDEEEDSQIELIFNEENGVTELTLIHTNLSESGEPYRQGWVVYYFQPMEHFFAARVKN